MKSEKRRVALDELDVVIDYQEGVTQGNEYADIHRAQQQIIESLSKGKKKTKNDEKEKNKERRNTRVTPEGELHPFRSTKDKLLFYYEFGTEEQQQLARAVYDTYVTLYESISYRDELQKKRMALFFAGVCLVSIVLIFQTTSHYSTIPHPLLHTMDPGAAIEAYFHYLGEIGTPFAIMMIEFIVAAASGMTSAVMFAKYFEARHEDRQRLNKDMERDELKKELSTYVQELVPGVQTRALKGQVKPFVNKIGARLQQEEEEEKRRTIIAKARLRS